MPYEAAPGVMLWRRDELSVPPSRLPVPQAAQKTDLIVHHSGGAQLGRADFANWWAEIYRFHTGSNGWNDIGYNFGVANDPFDSNKAHVLEGRGWLGVGAHTIDHNTNGLGVCYLRNGVAGNGVKRAIRFLYDSASKTLGRPLERHVHSDYYSTECPGDLRGFVRGGLLVEAFPSSTSNPARLNAPVVGVMGHPAGYWEIGADGGVFAYGAADFFGSMGGQALSAPVVGGFVHPGLEGYWLIASDGGVFAFGQAEFLGSMAGRHLNAPVISGCATTSGNGYTLVASDGGVFAFGDAEFHGSPVR